MPNTVPQKSIAQLREEAILRLEQSGYDVRGKTPREVRQVLRQRHRKKQVNSTSNPAVSAGSTSSTA